MPKHDYPNLVASLMALVGNNSVITVHRPLVEFTESLEAGMMLSQLLYWTPRAKVPGGWIAKTDEEFHQELCLSKYGVRQGRNRLETMGILETKVKKFNGNPTVHYRLNLESLGEKWNLWIEKMDFAKSQEPSCEIEKSLTEITTENTTILQPAAANGNETIANENENPFKVWEATGKTISPYFAEIFTEWEKDYSSVWVCEAIRRGAKQNKMTLAYLEGILKRWKDSGGMDYPMKDEKIARIVLSEPPEYQRNITWSNL